MHHSVCIKVRAVDSRSRARLKVLDTTASYDFLSKPSLRTYVCTWLHKSHVHMYSVTHRVSPNGLCIPNQKENQPTDEADHDVHVHKVKWLGSREVAASAQRVTRTLHIQFTQILLCSTCLRAGSYCNWNIARHNSPGWQQKTGDGRRQIATGIDGSHGWNTTLERRSWVWAQSLLRFLLSPFPWAVISCSTSVKLFIYVHAPNTHTCANMCIPTMLRCGVNIPNICLKHQGLSITLLDH